MERHRFSQGQDKTSALAFIRAASVLSPSAGQKNVCRKRIPKFSEQAVKLVPFPIFHREFVHAGQSFDEGRTFAFD